MGRLVHVFENGVRVYDDHLLPLQRARYRKRNVHEAEEEDTFVELLRSLPTDGRFVDIGAAIGYYPLLAKRLAPGLEVHAVEPLDSHRQRFLENIALNRFEPRDFTIHAEAISSSVGRAKFLEDGFGSGIARNSGGERAGSLPTREVPTTTLDRLLERIGSPVDLCQMDVQGHEMDVLKGARRSMAAGRIGTFLIGTHSPRLHRGCIDMLTEHGYRIRHDLYQTKEQPDGILVASAPPASA